MSFSSCVTSSMAVLMAVLADGLRAVHYVGLLSVGPIIGMYRISGRIRYPAGYWLSGHYPVSGSYYPVNLNYFFYLTAHV